MPTDSSPTSAWRSSNVPCVICFLYNPTSILSEPWLHLVWNVEILCLIIVFCLRHYYYCVWLRLYVLLNLHTNECINKLLDFTWLCAHPLKAQSLSYSMLFVIHRFLSHLLLFSITKRDLIPFISLYSLLHTSWGVPAYCGRSTCLPKCAQIMDSLRHSRLLQNGIKQRGIFDFYDWFTNLIGFDHIDTPIQIYKMWWCPIWNASYPFSVAP